MILQTLIYDNYEQLVKKYDNYIYEPIDVILINDIEWKEWYISDELNNNDRIIRKIYLKQ